MSLSRPTITDALGRTFPMYRLRRRAAAPGLAPREHDLPEHAAARIQKRLTAPDAEADGGGRTKRGYERGLLMLAVSFGVVVLLMAPPLLLVLGLAYLAWRYTSALAWRLEGVSLKSVPPEEQVRAFLLEGYCPVCAYPLRQARDEDGLVRCPECGAAWVLPERAV